MVFVFYLSSKSFDVPPEQACVLEPLHVFVTAICQSVYTLQYMLAYSPFIATLPT